MLFVLERDTEFFLEDISHCFNASHRNGDMLDALDLHRASSSDLDTVRRQFATALHSMMDLTLSGSATGHRAAFPRLLPGSMTPLESHWKCWPQFSFRPTTHIRPTQSPERYARRVVLCVGQSAKAHAIVGRSTAGP